MRAQIMLLCLLAAVASPVFPQILLDSTEKLAWDRPEAWAMKYFTAVSMTGGYAGSEELDKGAVSIAFEAGWVPSLSEEERRVGFIGNKVEDLNRTSGFGRVRAGFGLPAGWVVTLGYVPPVEIGGVTPEVFNVALGRALVSKPSWTLSARLTGQAGRLSGDLTCPRPICAVTSRVGRSPRNWRRPRLGFAAADCSSISTPGRIRTPRST